MKLLKFFNGSTVHAEHLLELYDSLDFDIKRPRSEWREKLFDDHIVDWGVRAGVWRLVSKDKQIQIVGADNRLSLQELLKTHRVLLLQQALVMMLSAVDKMLHMAATSNNFVHLLQNGEFDDLIRNFPASEAYSIAMEARKRSGYGGKRKRRPANQIKEVISAKLYEITFLSIRRLEDICGAKGQKKIFDQYATHLGRKSMRPLRDQWSSIYRRRNAIVHECDIKRTKLSPKNIHFESVDIIALRKDIGFVRDFGRFLAGKLDP